MKTERGHSGGVPGLVSRWVFLVVALATTIGAPWMLGSEPVATQWVLLWGALATLVSGGTARALASVAVEKWPGVWVLVGALFFGALLLGEIAVQAANPSHAVVADGALWRLIPLRPESALPQGIAGRFHEGGDYIPFKNAARYALIFGTVWCFAAGLALGLVQRADARRWAVCVGANGIVMAVVCLVHRAMAEDLTLWRFQTTFDFTHSPIFFYKNHNGAYLAASLAIVLGLAAHSRAGVVRRTCEVGAWVLWLATVSVNSRAATAIATLWVLLYVGIRLRNAFRECRSADAARWLWPCAGAFVLLSAVVWLVGKAELAGPLARFGEMRRAPVEFLSGGRMRELQRQVGLEMWRDRPVWGWGGGAYVYLFNTYHERVPELAAQVYREQPQLHRFYNPTVNCDWVEFLVEYGVVGVACMLAAVGIPFGFWLRWRGWRDPLSLFLWLGVAGMVLHGSLDYILRNPALLVLGAGALIAAMRTAPGGERTRAPNTFDCR